MTDAELHPDCLVCRWRVQVPDGEECPGRGPAEPCDDFERVENRVGQFDSETGEELPAARTAESVAAGAQARLHLGAAVCTQPGTGTRVRGSGKATGSGLDHVCQ